ncbi:hypothetical protein H671_5g14693 [Cricetulus griseus]|nr:hypothetical protein H671_5g14693 [Cricetulus griseus]
MLPQARTSRTILKRYGESGQPFLVPDFRGIALSFSPFNLMLAVGMLYIASIMLSKICLENCPFPLDFPIVRNIGFANMN